MLRTRAASQAGVNKQGIGARHPALRRHALFLSFFTIGLILRVIAQFTYQPALFFFDSFPYIENAIESQPDTRRPLGYSVVFIRPLLIFGDLSVIPLVQHLLGLGMAALIYAVCVHRGVRGWLSALAAAPVLLDGYQLQIEQMIASDTFFQALIVSSLALLIWRRPAAAMTSGAAVPPVAAALAGLLVGVAATARLVGLPLLAVMVLYIVIANRRWSMRIAGAAALLAAGVAPLLVYATWTYGQTGEFQAGSSRTSGKALYARSAPVADCDALAAGGAPPYILDLCPELPRDQRPKGARYYLNRSHHGPAFTADYPPGVNPFDAQREFGKRVVGNQPFDIAGAVLHDFIRGFALQRTREPGEWPLETWRFDARVKNDIERADFRAMVLSYNPNGLHVVSGTGAFLRGYQSVVYARGIIFGAGILVPILALTRARRAHGSGLLLPALAVAVTATGLLFTAALFAFSWRYQLPSIPLLPWSLVLGLAALFPRLTTPDSA